MTAPISPVFDDTSAAEAAERARRDAPVFNPVEEAETIRILQTLPSYEPRRDIAPAVMEQVAAIDAEDIAATEEMLRAMPDYSPRRNVAHATMCAVRHLANSAPEPFFTLPSRVALLRAAAVATLLLGAARALVTVPPSDLPPSERGVARSAGGCSPCGTHNPECKGTFMEQEAVAQGGREGETPPCPSGASPLKEGGMCLSGAGASPLKEGGMCLSGAGASPLTEGGIAAQGGAWLLERQLPQGGWDAETLGDRPEFAPALTALGLLALHRQAPEANREAVLRGATALCAMQAPDGSFGRGEALRLNQTLVSAVLLEINQSLRSPVLGEAIAAAQSFSRRAAASGDGTWGYASGAGRHPAAAGLFAAPGGSSPQQALRDGLRDLPRLRTADDTPFYTACLAALDLR